MPISKFIVSVTGEQISLRWCQHDAITHIKPDLGFATPLSPHRAAAAGGGSVQAGAASSSHPATQHVRQYGYTGVQLLAECAGEVKAADRLAVAAPPGVKNSLAQPRCGARSRGQNSKPLMANMTAPTHFSNYIKLYIFINPGPGKIDKWCQL